MAANAEVINQRDLSRRRKRLFYTGMTISFVMKGGVVHKNVPHRAIPAYAGVQP
jgi:hypothetical protein